MKTIYFLLISVILSCSSVKSSNLKNETSQSYIVEMSKLSLNSIDSAREFWCLQNNYENENNDILLNESEFEIFYVSFTDMLTVGLCCADSAYDNEESIERVDGLNSDGVVGYTSYSDALENGTYFKKQVSLDGNDYIVKVYKVNMEYCTCGTKYTSFSKEFKYNKFVCPYDIKFLKLTKNEKTFFKDIKLYKELDDLI